MTDDYTPTFLKVKDAFENAGLTMTDRYIGMLAHFIHWILPKNELAAFIDSPGVPPTGLSASGDISKPGDSIIPPAGKGEGVAIAPSPSTRTIVKSANPHLCKKCQQVIKPGEKFITNLKETIQSGNKLPKAEYDAEHIDCP